MIADVVSIAASQLGVAESGGNNRGTPFDRYALPGEDPLSWCARFVRWCFTQAGLRLPGNPYLIASVANLQAALEAAGAWLPATTTPMRGDLILLLERGQSDAGIGHHVGLVERVDADLVHSIDGNWGDAVRRVQRKITDADIWGYGRWPLPPAA